MEMMKGGTQGELQVRGKSSMIGYLDNPTATAESLDDGWIKTGDKGFIEDQKLYITGRIKVGDMTRQENMKNVVADCHRNLSKCVAGRFRQPNSKPRF